MSLRTLFGPSASKTLKEAYQSLDVAMKKAHEYRGEIDEATTGEINAAIADLNGQYTSLQATADLQKQDVRDFAQKVEALNKQIIDIHAQTVATKFT